jgi:hypothetical protein
MLLALRAHLSERLALLRLPIPAGPAPRLVVVR